MFYADLKPILTLFSIQKIIHLKNTQICDFWYFSAGFFRIYTPVPEQEANTLAMAPDEAQKYIQSLDDLLQIFLCKYDSLIQCIRKRKDLCLKAVDCVTVLHAHVDAAHEYGTAVPFTAEAH